MSTEYLINENGASVMLIREWLPENNATELFEHLRDNVKWESHEVSLYGKKFVQRRLIYACGNDGLTHKYSGLTLPLHPWIPQVKTILDRIMNEA